MKQLPKFISPFVFFTLISLVFSSASFAASDSFMPLDISSLLEKFVNSEVYQIRGNSMKSFFGEGTNALVIKQDYSEIKKGQIILFTNDKGKVVCHRAEQLVFNKLNKTYVWETKGFNNNFTDLSYVTKDNFIGVVYILFYDVKRAGLKIKLFKGKEEIIGKIAYALETRE